MDNCSGDQQFWNSVYIPVCTSFQKKIVVELPEVGLNQDDTGVQNSEEVHIYADPNSSINTTKKEVGLNYKLKLL